MSEPPASSAAFEPPDSHAKDEPAGQGKENVPMNGLEKIRSAFLGEGFGFPRIPEELASRLEEQERWHFSSRKETKSPYDIHRYVEESYDPPEPYVLLAHSGYGFNSYVIAYYLVFGPMRLFLHLAWGGAYMDNEANAAEIKKCFSLADEITSAANTSGKLFPDEHLIIACSDFYGSHWGLSVPERHRRSNMTHESAPDFLAKILKWLNDPKPRRPRLGR